MPSNVLSCRNLFCRFLFCHVTLHRRLYFGQFFPKVGYVGLDLIWALLGLPCSPPQYSVLLPHVMKVLPTHFAKIVGPHHGDIRRHLWFEHPFNDFLLQGGNIARCLSRGSWIQSAFNCTCEHADFTEFEVAHLETIAGVDHHGRQSTTSAQMLHW